MSSNRRVMRGAFFAYGGNLFAFLDTEEPFSIPECAALMRRAQEQSGGRLGTVTVRLLELPQFPNMQGFMVLLDRRHARRATFESMVRQQLFAGSNIIAPWVTRVSDERMLWALIMREALRHQ